MKSSASSVAERKSARRSSQSKDRGKKGQDRASRRGQQRVSAKRRSRSNRGNKVSSRGREQRSISGESGGGRRSKRGQRSSQRSKSNHRREQEGTSRRNTESSSGRDRRGRSSSKSQNTSRRGVSKSSGRTRGRRSAPAAQTQHSSSTMARGFASPIADFAVLSDELKAKLKAAGIQSVSELLFTLPKSYHDRRKLVSSDRAIPGDEVIIGGLMENRSVRVRFSKGEAQKWVVTDIRDGAGAFKAVWEYDNPRPKLMDIPMGSSLVLWGKAEEHKDEVVLVEPKLERIDQHEALSVHRSGFVPMYEVAGIDSAELRDTIHRILIYLRNTIPDIIPGRHSHTLEEALWNVHFPPSDSDLEVLNSLRGEAYDHVVRSELFLYALSLSLKKDSDGPESVANIKIRHGKVAHFVNGLSAGLTDDQRAAFEDIKRDVLSRRPMNRLIQADMGAGKTVVAVLAALLVIENKQQVAFVVPSDVSAERRHSVLVDLLDRIGVRCELLTTQIRGRKRDRLISRLRKGEIDMVIGTQNLFHEAVQFRRLGLVVVEEQHIVGLKHQATSRRGVKPHLLVLTASPVPTPIAFLKYGDLHTSKLSEKPNGRASMETHVFSQSDREVGCRLFAELIGQHKQAFVLHSRGLREEGITELKRKLAESGFDISGMVSLPDIMYMDTRRQVLADFKARRIQLLLLPLGEEDSLDTSNVSGMLVDGAEGCALTYLNKLRVMAEFGAHDGGCVFIVSGPDAEAETKRIGFLEEISDGFELASRDLKQRGLRAFLGGNLNDLPNFQVVDLNKHLNRLEGAISEARRWEGRNANWQGQEKHLYLRVMIEERWGNQPQRAKGER